MDAMWQEYGMEELEKGMQKLFPASDLRGGIDGTTRTLQWRS